MLKILGRKSRRDDRRASAPQQSETGFFPPSLSRTHTNDQEPPQMTEEPETVNTEDLAASDIVIAVMGPTGSGKSTLICSASGRDTKAVGHQLRSYTDQVSAVKFWDKESNRYIVLVDTPGFDDTFKSDLDILNLIAEWLVSSYNSNKLLSGILYLHRITDNRVAGSSLKNLRVFRKICGKDALDKVYLTTTMWDEVEPDVGESRLEQLKKEYWKGMISQGAQVVRCKNGDDSQKMLVRQIISKHGGAPGSGAPPLHLVENGQEPSSQSQGVDDVLEEWCLDGFEKSVELRGKGLLIQEEMVQFKKELKETAAGQQLYSQLETLVEKRSELLRKLNKEKKNAASNPEIVAELQKECDVLREQVDDNLRQMQQLKLPRLKRLSNFLRQRD